MTQDSRNPPSGLPRTPAQLQVLPVPSQTQLGRRLQIKAQKPGPGWWGGDKNSPRALDSCLNSSLNTRVMHEHFMVNNGISARSLNSA